MLSFGRVGNAAYRDVPGVYVSIAVMRDEPVLTTQRPTSRTQMKEENGV